MALKFVPPEGEREGFRIAWNKDCLKARDSQGIGLVNSQTRTAFGYSFCLLFKVP